MARANKLVQVEAIKNWASVVRTEAAKSEIRVCGGADEDARVSWSRELENQRAADGKISSVSDHASRARLGAEPLAQGNDANGKRAEQSEQ